MTKCPPKYKWSKSSLKLLDECHPDLQKIFMRAIEITPIDLKIICGSRTMKEQKRLLKIGASQTLNSYHLESRLTGYSHAVDVVPLFDMNKDGKISGAEMFSWPLYYKIAPAIKKAVRDVGLPEYALEWGGNWTSFKDGPHWQLSNAYRPHH